MEWVWVWVERGREWRVWVGGLVDLELMSCSSEVVVEG